MKEEGFCHGVEEWGPESEEVFEMKESRIGDWFDLISVCQTPYNVHWWKTNNAVGSSRISNYPETNECYVLRLFSQEKPQHGSVCSWLWNVCQESVSNYPSRVVKKDDIDLIQPPSSSTLKHSEHFDIPLFLLTLKKAAKQRTSFFFHCVIFSSWIVFRILIIIHLNFLGMVTIISSSNLFENTKRFFLLEQNGTGKKKYIEVITQDIYIYIYIYVSLQWGCLPLLFCFSFPLTRWGCGRSWISLLAGIIEWAVKMI